MIIQKANIFTNEIRYRDIDVTREQVNAWMEGALIQDAMPHLSEDDREFMMTGMLPGEYETRVGGE